MVRAVTIPESNCTYGRRRVGSPRPPKRLTRSPIHPDRSQPAQEGSRQDPPKVLFWFHFWKYKFRQKILLSEVEICRQKILISFLECTVIPNSYSMIKDRLAADLLTRSHDCD